MDTFNEDLVKVLNAHDRVDYVGSRVTCYPPPMVTDCDILCLTKDVYATIEELQKLGFILDGSCVINQVINQGRAPYGAVLEFWSLKKNEYNLIITDNPSFYDKFMLATRVSTQLNLMDKADRVMVFQAILYGNG